MKLIVCIAKNKGISFNHRRVSRDAVVCDDILSLTQGAKLWMDPYSEVLFEGKDADIIYDTEYFMKAGASDFVFYEKGDLSKCVDRLDKIEEIYLYKWNRDYPADEFFTMPKKAKLIDEISFVGKSHANIIREHYKCE